MSAHKNGLWSLNNEARRISKIEGMKENDAEINRRFEEEWEKVRELLSGGAKIEKV